MIQFVVCMDGSGVVGNRLLQSVTPKPHQRTCKSTTVELGIFELNSFLKAVRERKTSQPYGL